MTTLVLDTGVAAKWFLPAAAEELVPEALHLLHQHELGKIEFVVPDLFWAEFGNLSWNAARRARWSKADALNAVREILRRNFLTIGVEDLLQGAFEIAGRYDRTVYDSLYVFLAVELHADFNALAGRFPVKWLGAFSIT